MFDWLPGPTPIRNTSLYHPISTNDNDEVDTGQSQNEDIIAKARKNEYDFYLDIMRIENVGIMVSYFSVGFSLYFIPTPMNYYLINKLNASSAQIGVMAAVTSLPWSFKIFYGLLSDSVPIAGYRRKPYFFIGWTIFVFISISLGIVGAPGINLTIVCGFLMTCALLLADVATDALSVERAKLESNHQKGSFQTTGITTAFLKVASQLCVAYTVRAVGMVWGAVMGALLYNGDTWGWGLSISEILYLNGVVPGLLILYFGIPLVELGFSARQPGFYTQIHV
jgi:MFS family permease